MAYKDVIPPAGGKISIVNGKLQVPDHPILPFIRGDGTGPDIWAASVRVLDAAVQKAYGGKRKIAWFEVFAGEESFKKFNNWLPDDTVEAVQGISGGHQRSVDHAGRRRHPVAQRRLAPELDLYVCLRPVQWFQWCAVAREASGEGGTWSSSAKIPRTFMPGLILKRAREAALKTLEFLKNQFSEGFQKNPVWGGGAGNGRHWHQTGFKARHGAAHPLSHSIRDHEPEQVRHDCPQGQHHEVHRRRLP